MRGLPAIAPALTRLWVQWYTFGMPPELRDVRRAEIDSDLWEHRQAAAEGGEAPRALALDILFRLMLGVPDDIGWRNETMRPHRAGVAGRIGTMTITIGQMRWMSVCVLVAGVLQIGARIAAMLTGAEIRSSEAVLWLFVVTAPLAFVGVLALFAQHRQDIGPAGRAGFYLTLAGWGGVFVSFAATMISNNGLVFVPASLAFVIAIPLGFLLLGIGLPRSSRTVPLIVGCYLLAGYVYAVLSSALAVFPPVPLFGNELQSIMIGLGLAGIGYSVWSGTKPEGAWSHDSSLKA